jgi:hypothetical protein
MIPTTLQGYNKMLDAWTANKLPEEIATTLEHVIFGSDCQALPAGRRNGVP